MRLKIPSALRYGVVAVLEGNPSGFTAAIVRSSVLVALLLMATPWSAAREIALGPSNADSGLKPALRSMLWVWNRSWIPLKFKMGTFFDIGWYLSADGCQALHRRGFLSRDPLARQCDLAQLELATIQEAARSSDSESLIETDKKIRVLVSGVLNDAVSWAALAQPAPANVKPRNAPAAAPSVKASKQFDNHRTRAALLAFDDLAQQLGLRYFLVSGTFLGVVRDGSFIGHDHDIDLGVFEEDLLERLLPALSDAQEFTVNAVDYICLRDSEGDQVQYAFMDKPAIIRLAHCNGVSVDLFIHFHDGEQVWHGSGVHRWNNADFELQDYSFLGRSFKGAIDFDRYLTENYGWDWRVPKSDFNVNFDTPNLSFVGTANALVYFAWMVANAVAANNPLAVDKYVDMLTALGAVGRRDGLLHVK